jgi:hypothetical protein
MEGERLTLVTLIAISLRPPSSMTARHLDSRTSWACARSTSARGVPRSTSHDDAVDEPQQARQTGPVGQSLQGCRQVRAGAGLGETRTQLR